MTEQEKSIVIDCLQRSLNELDTGTTTLSRTDAAKQGLQCPPLTGVLAEKRALIANLIERFRKLEVSKPAAIKPTATKTINPSVKEALEQVDRIVAMCEEVQDECDNSDGVDFAASVMERTQSIGETVDDRQHITEKQQEALDNMESGISRWLR